MLYIMHQNFPDYLLGNSLILMNSLLKSTQTDYIALDSACFTHHGAHKSVKLGDTILSKCTELSRLIIPYEKILCSSIYTV
jgi:hypothetical protein